MMTPVGRLIMVRSIDKRNLLNAMSLVTMPALIGPICGPPLGGFITTYASWHWIFLINVPIGLARHRFGDALYRQCPRRTPRRLSTMSDLYCPVLPSPGLPSAFRPWGSIFCRPALSRRCSVVGALSAVGVCRARQTHAGADPRSVAAQAADLPRQHLWRLPVPARHRRVAVPAAAVAADRLRSDAVPIRPHHLHHRARLDVHESRRRQRAQPLRLPQRAALQCARLKRFSRRLRHFRARHALLRR